MKVGDVVMFNDHLLEVRKNTGQCRKCFFHDRICSGIACQSYERTESGNVWFKLIPKRKKKNSPSPDTQKPSTKIYGTVKRKVERPRNGNHIRGRLNRIQANRERAARATQREKARKLEVLSDKRGKRVKLRGSSLRTRWKFRPRGRYDERFRVANPGTGTETAA